MKFYIPGHLSSFPIATLFAGRMPYIKGESEVAPTSVVTLEWACVLCPCCPSFSIHLTWDTPEEQTDEICEIVILRVKWLETDPLCKQQLISHGWFLPSSLELKIHSWCLPSSLHTSSRWRQLNKVTLSVSVYVSDNVKYHISIKVRTHSTNLTSLR